VRRLLGGAFGAISALRVEAYRRGLLPRHRLAGPVVSVGNLGVGGSGKTPVVEAIARMLRDKREPVAILSRGYRGRFAGEALVVSDGSSVFATAAEAGDEPVMLARALPGVIAAAPSRRASAGASTFSTTASSTCGSSATSTSSASTFATSRTSRCPRGACASGPRRSRAPTSCS
jgi:tetraacyldisaccharide 4'-kinase